ncbi:hypothetical protein [Streptomyces sp. NPDC001380]|uniref:hypothetical protein n=1 Tax=Streptomyces sp. NPDC001380 TaxID=3364566 RepID=UPI003695C110
MSERATGERRLPAGTAAAVLLVAGIAVLGLVLAVTGRPSRSAAPDAGSAPAATAAAGGAVPPATGCAPRDTDPSLPQEPPADVTWSVVSTAVLPTSAAAGPTRLEGPVARCYARTPRGALMAAVNLFYRVGLAAPRTTVTQRQVVAGPGRDEMIRQLRQVDEQVRPGELAQVAGYRFVSYTPDTTVVTLVNGSAAAGSLKSLDVTVQWQDGDWKLVARPDGWTSTPATSLHSLVGFTPFGGV